MQKVDIILITMNHIDFETCKDLYDGDIVYSAILCVHVCLAAAKTVAKGDSVCPLPVGKAQGWKDRIDATICGLGRLKGTMETIRCLQ
jgi:hypothetical protein